MSRGSSLRLLCTNDFSGTWDPRPISHGWLPGGRGWRAPLTGFGRGASSMAGRWRPRSERPDGQPLPEPGTRLLETGAGALGIVGLTYPHLAALSPELADVRQPPLDRLVVRAPGHVTGAGGRAPSDAVS